MQKSDALLARARLPLMRTAITITTIQDGREQRDEILLSAMAPARHVYAVYATRVIAYCAVYDARARASCSAMLVYARASAMLRAHALRHT